MRWVLSARGDDYQIPNTPEEQAAGIRDIDVERENMLGFTWAHSSPGGVVLTVSPFLHFNRADYVGGPGDSPFVLKEFGERFSVSVNVLNLTNTRFLPDNSNTFGGTHYVNPRTVYVVIRWRFHY